MLSSYPARLEKPGHSQLFQSFPTRSLLHFKAQPFTLFEPGEGNKLSSMATERVKVAGRHVVLGRGLMLLSRAGDELGNKKMIFVNTEAREDVDLHSGQRWCKHTNPLLK